MFKWLEKYFTFSRMERNGIVALLTLSVLVLLAPKVYFYFKPVEHADNSKYKKEIEAFVNDNNILPAESNTDTIAAIKDSAVVKQDTTHFKKHRPTGYFEFDPNKIGVDGWMRLGFTEKQAQNIEKYKAKGGKFYRAQDLMRLWDMDEEHYYKLKPFVKIDVSALPKRNYDRH
jgi:competence protein ComEA